MAVLALFALPAAGATGSELAWEERVVFSESGYVAWRVQPEAGVPLVFEWLSSTNAASQLALSHWILEADSGRLLESSLTSSLTGQDDRVHVRAASTGVVVDYQSLDAEGIGSATAAFEPSSDAELLVVVLVASDGEVDGYARMRSEGGAVLGRTTGSAFLYRDSDFDAQVAVIASATAPVFLIQPGVGLSTVIQGNRSLDIQGRFFGAFYGNANLPTLALSYQSPSGASALPVECRTLGMFGCSSRADFAGAAAGAYEFRVDRELDAGRCALFQCVRPHVTLVGADVAWP